MFLCTEMREHCGRHGDSVSFEAWEGHIHVLWKQTFWRMEEEFIVSDGFQFFICWLFLFNLSLFVLFFLTLVIQFGSCACCKVVQLLNSYRHWPKFLFVAPPDNAYYIVNACAQSSFEIGHRYDACKRVVRWGDDWKKRGLTRVWTYASLLLCRPFLFAAWRLHTSWWEQSYIITPRTWRYYWAKHSGTIKGLLSQVYVSSPRFFKHFC